MNTFFVNSNYSITGVDAQKDKIFHFKIEMCVSWTNSPAPAYLQ
jgi:hypothetical protein